MTFKNTSRAACALAIVSSALAQTPVDLIDEDFTSATLITNSRIRSTQADGNFWAGNKAATDWTVGGGLLSNAGTSLTGSATEGALSQIVATDALATDLAALTLSFDYTVGATATLKFALIGYTANLQDGGGTSDILMNNGTSNGALQNNTQAELRYGDINLLTGADMTQSITNDLTFAPGTSGSHSMTIDLTKYSWHDDEPADATPANTPGLSGDIASIADFDYVVLVAVNDLSSDIGVTATTLDNIILTAKPLPTSTWDGDSDGNWATTANWVDDVLPTSSDNLIFTGIANAVTNNDLAAGIEYNGISFANTADGENFSLGGNSIILGGDILQPSAASGSITDTISLDMELNGNRAVNSGTGHNLLISGIISQDGSTRALTKIGDGTLTLTAANTYAGRTNLGENDPQIAGGTLIIENDAAMGTGQLFFENDATFELGVSGLTVANELGIFNRPGALSLRTVRLDLPGTTTGSLTGAVDIRFAATNGFAVDVGTDDTLTMSGEISTGAGGGAGITKVGDGTLIISSTTNSYLGNTTVSEGTLSLGDGALDTQLSDSSDVIVESGAVLDLNFTSTDTIRSLFVGGVQVAAGTYSAADFTELTGAGFLEVTTSLLPNIISIEVDGSGDVVLTLDGPVTGLTVQQSEDLATDFADVASTPGPNTLTVDAANVDLDMDGADFFRVRN
ncbi:beta strand repeat-containing protein [Haloferula sp.]|uniref:beta strand repeat-containing protein n=1 Tax=Haloferula sp. TaxID=2497595 RepID=UPI00329AB5D5